MGEGCRVPLGDCLQRESGMLGCYRLLAGDLDSALRSAVRAGMRRLCVGDLQRGRGGWRGGIVERKGHVAAAIKTGERWGGSIDGRRLLFTFALPEKPVGILASRFRRRNARLAFYRWQDSSPKLQWDGGEKQDASFPSLLLQTQRSPLDPNAG